MKNDKFLCLQSIFVMLMLTEFKTLIAVAQAGTFTAAGRSLGLTQSAVSAQIKRLEAFIGMPLFERSAKSAQLNAQGQEVLAQAKEAVALVDRMRAPHLPGGVGGTVRIGAIASVQQHLLAQALLQFRALYPEVRVRVVPGYRWLCWVRSMRARWILV